MEDLCPQFLQSQSCPQGETCLRAHKYSDLSNLDNWVIFDAPGLELLDFLAYKYFSHHYYKVRVLPGVGPIVRFATPEDAATVIAGYKEYYNPTPLRVFHETGAIQVKVDPISATESSACENGTTAAPEAQTVTGEASPRPVAGGENGGTATSSLTPVPSTITEGSRQVSFDASQLVPASPALRQGGAPVLPYAKEPTTPMSFPGTPDLRGFAGEGAPGTPTQALPRTRVPGGHARDYIGIGADGQLRRPRIPRTSSMNADALASFSSDISVPESEQSVEGLSHSMSSLSHNGHNGHHSHSTTTTNGYTNGNGSFNSSSFGGSFGFAPGCGPDPNFLFSRGPIPIPGGASPPHCHPMACTCHMPPRCFGASSSPLEGGVLNNSPPSLCGVPSFPPPSGSTGNLFAGIPPHFLNSSNIQGSFASSRGSGCATPTTPLTPLQQHKHQQAHQPQSQQFNSPARPAQHRSVAHAKHNGGDFANSPKKEKARARPGFGGNNPHPFAESYTDKVLQILRDHARSPKLLNCQMGWEAMKIIWNIQQKDLDEPVLQYLNSRSPLQQEQILLSFAAIDLSSVNNLSAYLNCLIKEHEGTNQVCLHFLAGLCESPQKCGYVHPVNTLGWTALQSKWGITYQTLDYAVLNYLCKKPIEQQDTILIWLSEMNLSEVHNMSAYLSSAIQKFDSQSIIPHPRHSNNTTGFPPSENDSFKGKRPQKLWPRIRQNEGSNPGTPTMRNSPSTPNSGLRPNGGRVYSTA